MAQATNVQKFILFTLGSWYLEANRRFLDRQIEIVISKATFIDLVLRANLAQKQARALYKNLEDLEKRKLVSYAHKSLALTVKGQRLFEKIYHELRPYVNVIHALKQKDPFSYARPVQTVLSRLASTNPE
jgi:predicted transcriptional regulator